MSTVTYKCPSCGAPLTYSGGSREMACGSCGNHFDVETVREVSRIEQEGAAHDRMDWDMPDAAYSAEETQRAKAYTCSSCGAELITDETTVATNCAFCGSPSIMPTQFTNETRPHYIIPFTYEKNQAEQAFSDYFKGKRLLSNIFRRDNRIDEIRQLYVPYWVFRCEADAQMSFNAQRVSSYRSGQYMVTRTQHFLLHRAGSLGFDKLPVDASRKIDNDITESIEPYRLDQSLEFSLETLSGAMANRADVPPQECEQRANERVRQSTEAAFRATVGGYSSASVRTSNIQIQNGQGVPVLYPMWLITTKKGGTTYTFAINGQTGQLTTNIPYSKGKFFAWLFGLAGVIAVVGYGALLLLGKMGVLR